MADEYTCGTCESCNNCQGCDSCQSQAAGTFTGWDADDNRNTSWGGKEKIQTDGLMLTKDEFNRIITSINSFYTSHGYSTGPVALETKDYITAEKYNQIRDALYGNKDVSYEAGFYNIEKMREENGEWITLGPDVEKNVTIVTARSFQDLIDLHSTLYYNDSCRSSCLIDDSEGNGSYCGDCCEPEDEGDEE